ncbi:hypothetical protein [Priestia endophytica]|uniref:hypothetical protein n=1 Tax=Priestia endophytica TaxID=135735 RepID=UPI00203C5924|nr:hypothetical protein [Priestia endophytica]MCM3536596.1 hypothetical protein [Priestia endophytica]
MSYLYKDVDANRQLYTSAYQDTDGKPTTRVNIGGSDYQAAVDVQNRYQKTIQTHSAVNVAVDTYVNSAWYDTSGFDKIAVTMVNDANTNSSFGVHWSHDGTGYHGNDTLGTTATKMASALVDVKARYFRVYVYNKDTAAAHTMSSWAMLKV